ncbi:MAG TPA: hypothetical protein DDW52_23130 [Planctomycetaceae bacterium]|nr:hypothetical protein [Planctomycetaceae bacterium]
MSEYHVEQDISEDDGLRPFEDMIEANSIEEAAQEWLNRRRYDWLALRPNKPYYVVIVTTPKGEKRKVQVKLERNDSGEEFAGPCFVCETPNQEGNNDLQP